MKYIYTVVDGILIYILMDTSLYNIYLEMIVPTSHVRQYLFLLFLYFLHEDVT